MQTVGTDTKVRTVHQELQRLTYREWCQQHNCTHAHCPNECEHPQPFSIGDKLYCGRCAIRDKTGLIEMIPCTPEVCD